MTGRVKWFNNDKGYGFIGFRENEDIDQSSTGMGLFIVKSILESHNYEYGVENIESGVRSYFTIKK